MIHIKNNKLVIFLLLVSLAIIIAVSTAKLSSRKNYSETSTKPEQNTTNETVNTVTNNITPMASEIEYSDNDDLKFSDLNGIKFWFASGAGAWSTSVTIHPDGTFSAYYHDSEANTGYLNPEGTTFECNFSGKFSSLKKTGPYQYSLKCESIEMQEDIGEIKFKDGIAYVTTDPYGFENADEFELYLPGKQISELSSDYLDWTNGYAQDEVLNCYGLYNVGGKEGFIVWPESLLEESETGEINEPTSSPIIPYSSSEIAKMQKEYKNNDYFSFSDLDGFEFMSIREGIIGPSIMIQPDGTFNGTFNETFPIDRDDDSLDSIVCECNYNGQFSSLTKTGPYEYTMKCSSFEIQGTVGDETIVDGRKIITIEPYIFENTDEFILYLPGKKVSELPEGLLKWNPDLINMGVIPSYILYNVEGENSFVIIPG